VSGGDVNAGIDRLRGGTLLAHGLPLQLEQEGIASLTPRQLGVHRDEANEQSPGSEIGAKAFLAAIRESVAIVVGGANGGEDHLVLLRGA
jgi:hypothetical protein